MLIPKEVQSIIAKLQKADFEAFAVGGCVRDALLGKQPNDWDVATDAKPDEIIFVSDLPKTRSGKIMRRILRNIAEGKEELGDLTTLRNPEVVEEIKEAIGKS